MTPFVRLCSACDGSGSLKHGAPCKHCETTGVIDVLDRLFSIIENASSSLSANVSLTVQDAQFLANECEAIRSTEWMQPT